MERINSGARYDFLDSLRGLLLLGMIVYHFFWDLVYLFQVELVPKCCLLLVAAKFLLAVHLSFWFLLATGAASRKARLACHSWRGAGSCNNARFCTRAGCCFRDLVFFGFGDDAAGCR